MHIQNYLDSTYLKTPEEASISKAETLEVLKQLTDEAIEHDIFAIMIRPDYVKDIRNYLDEKQSDVKLGTVIGFPEGTYSLDEKLKEATKAVNDGAEELDFVINYVAYKNGQKDLVKKEFLDCTSFGLEKGRVVKWIIEIAALDAEEIKDICQNIATWARENFPEQQWPKIFIKSSTGFYKTDAGQPNGATVTGIKIMLENSGGLPVKAAGGVKTSEDAVEMIKLGVKRIGTSSAKALLSNDNVSEGY